MFAILETSTLSTSIAQNAIISANFLVCKFCGNAEFPENFGQLARNSV